MKKKKQSEFYSVLEALDKAERAVSCSTCKHQGNCKYQSMMNSWRYLGTECNLWESWNDSIQ